ncbi:hypothetical protein KJ632_05560 [Patescibacteria group bacterium]|nr:hypothetical protein [Patescibacteria group bacterium]
MNIQDKNMLLQRYALGREAELIEAYILNGPTALKVAEGFSPEQWQVIFDYLVFEHNLLYKTVLNSDDFFIDEYVKSGMAHVREILDVVDNKYNLIWEICKDYIMISQDGLYAHVFEHRNRYMTAFKARGGDFVRKVLGIWDLKYTQSWERVLDILLNAVCDGLFSERTFDNGLETFTRIWSGVREHRPISKFLKSI